MSEPKSGPAERKSRRASRWKRRFKHTVIFSSVVLILVVCAGIIIVHSRGFRNFLIQKVEQRLRVQSGMTLSVDRFQLWPFSLRATMDGVRLRALPESSGPLREAGVDRIEIDLGAATLLGGRFYLQSLSLLRPWGELSAPAASSIETGSVERTTPSHSPPSPQAAPMSWRIKRFRLEGGRLVFGDRVHSLDAALEEISAEMNYKAVSSMHIGLIRSGPGEIRYSDRAVSLSALTADFELGEEEIHFKTLSLESDPMDLNLKGWIRSFWNNPLLELETEGLVRLPALEALLGDDRSFAGELDLNGSIWGGAYDPEGEMNLTGRSLVLAGIPLDSVRAELSGKTSELELKFLQLDGAGGDISAQARIEMGESGVSSASLEWKSISLGELSSFLGVSPLGISACSDGHLSAQIHGWSLETLTGEGKAAFIPVGGSVAAGQGFGLQGRLDFSIANDRLALNTQDLKLNGHSLSLSAEIDREAIRRARFRFRSDELSRLPHQARVLLGPGAMESSFLQDIGMGGRITLTGNLSGKWHEPSGGLVFSGRDLRFGKNAADAVEGTLRLNGTGLELKRLSLQLPRGYLTAEGRMSYHPSNQAWGEAIAFSAEVRDIDLAPWAEAWFPELGVRGEGSATIEGSGSISNPDVKYLIDIKEGEIAGETFDSLAIEGRSADRWLEIRRLEAVKGKGSLNGELFFEPASHEYRIQLSTRNLDLESFAALQTSGLHPQGRLHILLEGAGNWDAPHFRMEVEGRSIRVNQAEWPLIRLEASADGIEARAHCRLPDGKAEIDVRIPLSGSRIVEGRLKTEALDFLAWMPAAEAAAFSSALSSTLEFYLPSDDWKKGWLTWKISEASVRYGNLFLRTMGPWSLDWERLELQLQDMKLAGPAFELAASGRIPLEYPVSSGIKIQGAGELSQLAFLLPGLNPEGILKGEGAINGSLNRPEINARIELENGSLEAEAGPFAISNAGMKVVIGDGWLNLENLSFETAGGKVSGFGRIPMSAVLPEKGTPPEAEAPEIDATLRLNGLDPIAWLPRPESAASSGLHGEITGIFNIGGRIDSIEALTVEGALSRIAFNSAGLKLENPREVQARIYEGRLMIDPLELEGGDSNLRLRADISLLPAASFSAELNAGMDVALFNPLLEGLTAGGRLDLALSAKGTLDAPIVSGRGGVSQGYLEFKDFPLTVTDINGPFEISPNHVTAHGWKGIGNGGALDLDGDLVHDSFQIRSARVDLRAAGVPIDTPEGLQGVVGGRIGMQGDGTEWRVTGNVRMERGFFGKTVYPGGELFGLIGRPAVGQPDLPPIVRDIRLDVQLETVDALVIENNLAELEMSGNMRLTGTPGMPLLTGGISNRSIGEITFGERRFEVETVAVDYSEAPPMEGRLNLTGHTRMKHLYDDLDITLTLTGPLNRLEYNLDSIPARSQGELASLLITGYGTEKLKSETANVIGSQMILYFASPLASPVTDRIRRWLGAEEVSLEPINIASEEDPGARFTFRKGLIRNVDLIYSIDIANSQDQAWLLEYSLSRNFSLSTFRRDDGSYGGSISSRFSLGGSRGTGPRGRTTSGRRELIRQVEFKGTGSIPIAELKKAARLQKKGKPFNYHDLRRSSDRIESLYKRADYIDIVIDPRVSITGDRAADVTFEIEPGRRASLRISGDMIEKKLEKELIENWNGRLSTEMSLSAAVRRIKNHLIGKGYYAAEVESRVKAGREEEIVYVFQVRRGPQYRLRNFRLTDDSPVTTEDVLAALKRISPREGKGPWLLLTRFSQAKTQIGEMLARKGYRGAEIGRPIVTAEPKTGVLDVFLPLKSGAISRVASVEFKDPLPFSERELTGDLLLSPGDVLDPDILMEDRRRLDRIYRSMGYQDIRITPDLIPLADTADLSLVYRIETGEPHHIARIRFSGNRHTPERVIRREMLFKEGDPLNMEKLILSQKRLYQLGVFRSVNIRRDSDDMGGTQATVLIEVEEAPPLTIGYGLRYNTEEKLEGFGQIDFSNLIGRAGRSLFFYRQNQRQKDLRLSFKSPYLLGRKLETLHSFSYLEEIESIFKSREIGYTIQQKIELPWAFSLSYLYRLSRIHTFELESFGPFPFDITVFLSELQVYLLRDTRDNKLNARSGSFHSLSLTYSPAFLGSDLTFVSFFGQSSLFFDLGRGWVWASNLRLGLADAFDQVLIPSRRFFSGGGNSLRGFQRDMVGPYDEFFQQSLGGEGLLVINQELRFPVWRWLGGVFFFDAGNVYAELTDFNPRDLRYAVGAGIRIDMPFALIRLDYGRNLDPLPWEKRGGWFFSLGQSF